MKDSQKQKAKKENLNYFPLLFLIVVLILLTAASVANYFVLKSSFALKLNSSPIVFSISPYPKLNVLPSADVSAEGFAVLDSDSHTIFYSRNSNRFFSPASTTKILTALVGLDKYSLSDILTVKSDNIEGSTIGLKKGDRLSFESLLYAMMLPSSNDAATTVADNDPKGRASFIVDMNKKAESLGLFSTHLVDPVGLEDQTNFITPSDLSILGDIAMQNPTLTRIVKTQNKTIKTLDGKEFSLSNLNILLGKDGVDGVKTGFTETSGQVLVTTRKKDGKRVVISVMQSQDRFGDTEKILEALDKGLTYLTIHP